MKLSRLLLYVAGLYLLAAFWWASHAHAQAGSSPWASWSTERVGGQTRVTVTPAPGVKGQPSTYVTGPSAIGGAASRSVAADGASVRYLRSLSIPVTSGATGATQTLAVNAGRTITKEALVKAATTGARLSSPLGWGIMAGSFALAYLDWDPVHGLTTMTAALNESAPESYPAVQESNESLDNRCKAYAGGVAASMGIGGGSGYTVCTQGSCPEYWWVFYSGKQYVNGTNPAQYTCQFTAFTMSGNQTHTRGPITASLTCPNGGSLDGSTCVKDTSACPSGYSPLANGSGKFACAPNETAGAPEIPLSDAEVEDYIGKAVGTGNPAKTAQLADAVEGLPDSVQIPTSDVDLSGSQPQPQPSQSTTPTTNGGTKETTVTPTINYYTNYFDYSEHVVNIYKDAEGNEIGREEKEGEADIPGPSDSAFPEVPDFYTQKYPDGFGGVWNQKAAELQGSSLAGLIAALTPSIGSGGECPTWSLPGPLLGLSFDGNIAPPCWLWPVLKVIFMVTALFAARRIIFGG